MTDEGIRARHSRPHRAARGTATMLLAVAAVVVTALVLFRIATRDRAVSMVTIEADKPRHPAPASATGACFTDVTTSAGIDFVHESGATGDYYLPEEMGAGGAFFDYDGDGDMDIYLVQSGKLGTDNDSHRNRLYRNDGQGGFVDVSAASGADVPGYGMGCSAADYDDDGDVDLYITRVGPNVLLRNDGDGTFTDVTRDAGVGEPGFGAGAAFFDYDRDGHLDLYVTNYLNWSADREFPFFAPDGRRDYCNPVDYKAPSVDFLYRNLGDGVFEDVTVSAGISEARGNGLGVATADFDDDGWVDIYVANDQTPAFLWINQRDGTFVDDAAFAGCAFNADGMAIAGMGTVAEDLDGDGDLDLLVTNIRDEAHLGLRNTRGVFEDVSHAWGLDGWGVPYTGFGVGLFDQDHDGVLDAIIANGAVNRSAEPLRPGHPYAEPNQFIRRDDSGRFYDATAEAGAALQAIEMSRGTILGDYDNDGDIDVLITNNRGPARLLRNENRSGMAWLTLDLIPASGGRHAINARVEVESAGAKIGRVLRPHAGYLGSNDPRVHFGLGSATRVDRLRVKWPDGTSEVWTDLPVRAFLTITQRRSPGFDLVKADAPGTSLP